MKTRFFKHLIFDLDDTLLDTSHFLVPRAARQACEAMIKIGLCATVEECLRAREELLRESPRSPVFQTIVEHFGLNVTDASVDIASVARLGYDVFHNREVEKDISLLPGARDILRDMQQIYGLHLVTAGHHQTQSEKINILSLTSLFDSIHHIDPVRGEIKQHAFAKIISSTGIAPERHLSIGNRLDSDIADAKRIGCKTCWFRYGEYVHMRPSNKLEQPDYEIKSLQELIAACQL